MLISPNKLGVVTVAFGLTLGVVGVAGASSSVLVDRSAFEPKVTICHATDSESNPYNKIEVAQSAVDDRGHGNHDGDIIPPIAGVTPGLNWPEGEATFNNNCITTVEEVVADEVAEQKVTICHATNSENNPYNKITVAQSAVEGGHGNHTGPVWYPGAKDAGVRWGDIIPPSDGVTGVNWPAGESTFNNNCELPGATTAKPDKSKNQGPPTSTDKDK